MVRSVYVPQAGGFYDFDDTATDAEIVSYLQSKFPTPAPTAIAAPVEAPKEPEFDKSSLAGRFLYGLGTGISGIPGGLAALAYPAEIAAETPAGKASIEAEKSLREYFEIDPTKEATIPQQAAGALGSVASFLIPATGVAKGASLVGAAPRIAARLATGTSIAQGVAIGAEQRAAKIRDQIASGMQISEEEQLAAQRLSGLIGASEALPLNRFFAPIGTILSKVPASKAGVVEKIIQSRLSKITRAGAAEGAQEAASGLANDLMEAGVYNPNVKIGEDILSNAGTGAFAGSFVEGVIQLAAGRKLRPSRELARDIAARGAEDQEAARLGRVSQTAEDLRLGGVQGIVKVEPEEFDGITKFTIKDKTGKTFGQFDRESDAEEAIGRYQAETGAKVAIRGKVAGPKIFPVKIGTKKFGSIDEISTARADLIAKRDEAARFAGDPEIIQAGAESEGVSEAFYKAKATKGVERLNSKIKEFDDFLEAAAPKEPQIGEAIAEAPKATFTASEAEPPVGFYKTAKGSEYQVFPDGTTIRNKAARKDPGHEGDSGLKPRTVKTIYIDPKLVPGGAANLSAAGISGLGPQGARVSLKDGKANLVTWNQKENRWGVAPMQDNIPYSLSPEKGLQPLELWEPANDVPGYESYSKMHAGNEIVEISEAPVARAQLEPPIGMPQEATAVSPEGAPIDLATTPVGAVETPSVTTPEATIAVQEEAPRTYADAAAAGPKILEPNAETVAKLDKVYKELKTRVESIVPGDVTVNLQRVIDAGPDLLVRGQVRTERGENGIKVIIDLSTGIYRPNATVEEMVKELSARVDHEIIHALRINNLWRPAEWRMLSRAASERKVPGRSYTYLDRAQAIYTPNGRPITPVYSDPDVVLEEAVAEMYRDWIDKNASPETRDAKAPAGIVGLFNRATEFFRRIFRTLKSNSYEDIFKDVKSGEMLKREATPSEVSGPRLSASPLPPYIAQKSKTLFANAPDTSFFQNMTEFFKGGTYKTLNTIYGTVDISKGQKAAIAMRKDVVDDGAYLEHLEKLRNLKANQNFAREMADYSAVAAMGWKRRASQILASMIFRGKMTINFARAGDIQSATMKIEDDPDSLLNIFKILNQPGPVDATTGEQGTLADVFKLYATAKRAVGLKADGKPVPKELDDVFVRDTISFTQTQYPEVVKAYEMYQRFNLNLLTAAKDAEVISARELSDLTKRMDYYGFYREVYEEDIVQGTSTKTASKFDLRPYKGSEKGGLINDPLYVMVQNASFWTESIAKNIAARKAFNLARDMGEARLLGKTEKPDRSKGEEDEVMFFRENGEQKRFAVKDAMLVTAIGSDERVDSGAMMKLMALPTKILRESITRDPVFMVRNLLRDTVSSWITSGEDIKPFVDTARGFKEALKGGTSFQALMGRGVVGSYDLAMMEPRDIANTIRRRTTPMNVKMVTNGTALGAVVGSLWHRLGVWSEASDAATRIAVYDSALKQGMSEAEAAYRAIEIMDFSRRGANQFLSALTKLVPFLNARIQGLDVLYQAGAAGKRYLAGQSLGERDANLGKKFLIRGAMLAAISVAFEMWNTDDEDYQNLPDYLKTSNILIPLRDFGLKGQFLAIPKPFEAGLLFSTFPQQFYKSMIGEASTRENVNLFFSSWASTFGVNPVPQVAIPIAEVLFNHDMYTGLPLISEGKSRLAPELQYDSSTSSLAMVLSGVPIVYNFNTGKFEGMSPIAIDQLISGYAGPLGSYMVMAAGEGMRLFDVGPEKLSMTLSEAPAIKSFFIDAQARNPKAVSQAYELFRIVDEANRSFGRLRQIGDMEALTDFLEENRDVLKYKKYVLKLTNGLNKLSAQERRILQDKSLSDEEKRAEMERLREVRSQLTARVSEISKALGR